MSQVYKNIIAKTQFQPNKEWLQIKTIDMHTGGEPLRVIIDGFPELKGKIEGLAIRVPTPNVSLVDFVFKSITV